MKNFKLIFEPRAYYAGFKLGDMIYYVDFWTRREVRYFGYRNEWYDGPMKSFGFWFMQICWHYDY